MSDGGWYGYPPQEPDPYSQPQDYGNAPHGSGYDQYGRPAEANPQHQDYYPQQSQQPQQRHQQYPDPGQSGPQYRQQRPPQRPRPQPQPQPQQQPQQQAQNPYFQQRQQERRQQQQGHGYDTNGRSGSHGGYEDYAQQGYDTGGYQRQDYERSGYDTSAGYAGQGYDSAATYDAAAYGSGTYDTTSSRGSGSYDSGSYDSGASHRSGSYDTGSSGGGYDSSYGSRSQPSYSAAPRDPYSDLAEVSEEPDQYEYPGRGGGGRRRRAGGTGEQPQVGEDGRLGLLSDESTTRPGSSPAVDDDDDDEEDGGRRKGGRSGGKKDKKSQRSCMVIFLFFALIAGGLGYGGYQGYNWYESHYGPPADYSSTSGVAATAIVTIPSSATGTKIAQILFDAGVIKSERAFIVACNNNSQCPNIQANTYQIHKQMSAAAAVTALLNTGNVYNKAQLLVRPGERAADVFADLEQKTGWTQAQIVAAINSGQIDLPSYATAKTGTKYPFANIEGLLFTGTYQLPGYKTPTALLKAMVDQQVAMFNAVGLTQKASSLNMTPYQVLIVASMARAEAGSDASDLAKISGVIYTRLKNYSYSKLGFDTATLYGLGRTEPQPTSAELADRSNPYNLRVVRGLPPGPIDSVDQTALMGALAPTDSTDVFFCAVNGTIHYASNDTSWTALGKQYPGYCG
jgi:UPF0755 protein